MKAAKNFELMLLWCRPHPSLALHAESSCSLPSHSARILNPPPDHDKEQTSPLALLKARWPVEPACQNARCLRHLLELENTSLWPLGPGNLVCAHGTTILTNHESSELVGERILYAIRIRTGIV